MGTLSRDERITLAVFVGVGLLWITTGWHRLDVTFIALLGLGVLLTTGTMAWSTATTRTRRLGRIRRCGGSFMGELLNATAPRNGSRSPSGRSLPASRGSSCCWGS